MKRCTWIVTVLLVALLLATGSAFAGDGSGEITGGINLEPPNWGAYFRVWVNFDVHEVNASTHEADGMIRAQVYTPMFGWKRLWYQAECVSFGEVEGNPAAIVVAKIVRRTGWDDVPNPGDPGEYLRWQVVDGGTPGRNGDSFTIEYYDYANFIEYWPEFPDGGCTVFQGGGTNFADHGNLDIYYTEGAFGTASTVLIAQE